LYFKLTKRRHDETNILKSRLDHYGLESNIENIRTVIYMDEENNDSNGHKSPIKYPVYEIIASVQGLEITAYGSQIPESDSNGLMRFHDVLFYYKGAWEESESFLIPTRNIVYCNKMR